jgi:hypothetical protein
MNRYSMARAPLRVAVKRVAYTFGLISCCVLIGCGTAKTNPVAGKIVFKDGSDISALAGYRVDFQAVDQEVSGSGEVLPDGTFTISTYGNQDGAVPGKHKVAITPPPPLPDVVPPKPILPSKYASFETSGLEREIKPGPNEVTLEVERLK